MYIDAVRARDVEISSLKQERSSVEETHTVEITEVKSMYNKEMATLRKAVDQVRETSFQSSYITVVPRWQNE